MFVRLNRHRPADLNGHHHPTPRRSVGQLEDVYGTATSAAPPNPSGRGRAAPAAEGGA